MKDIALYIHIPFCNSKCDYCDFYSLCCTENKKEQFLFALKKEIEKHKKLLESRVVKTIYVGGGTPSVLSPNFFKELKQTLNKFCKYDNDLEFTVEVNPNSFNEVLAKTLKEIGVNRISVGLQSANDKLLKSIHRLHTFKQFLECLKIVKNYFDNFSIDLMVGLPNQTLRDVAITTKKVLKFNPKHISCYSLIVEDGTPLCKNKALLGKVPSDEKQLKMLNKVKTILQKNNFQQYEISSFSLIGENDVDENISKHNSIYWLGGDYLGFGPSAHSFVDGVRFSNDRNLEDYLAGCCKVCCETITKEMQREEQIMLGLRTKWGVDVSLFDKNKLDKMVLSGFVEIKNKKVVATIKGKNVLNLIIAELV